MLHEDIQSHRSALRVDGLLKEIQFLHTGAKVYVGNFGYIVVPVSSDNQVFK